MKIIRTANAGVLMEIDGFTVLFDGVADSLPPYIGTPENIHNYLRVSPPDILAFTHTHKDHYDEAYISWYKEITHHPVLEPGGACEAMVDGIKIKSIPTRHIGKANLPHLSYVLLAKQCVWFMGDASPVELKRMNKFPQPDILFVPFAYALAPEAWHRTKQTGARKIVLLHLPFKDDDVQGLRDAVLNTVNNDECLILPELGETFDIVN